MAINWDIPFEDYRAGMSLSDIARKHDIKFDTVKKREKRHWRDKGTKGQRDNKEGTRGQDKKEPVKTATKKKVQGVGVNGNLIPVTERSKSEAREISAKGGIASGKSRREKSAAKDVAKLILSGNIPLDDSKTSGVRLLLQEMGLPETELNMQAALVAGQTLSGMRGNHQAASLVLSLVSEDPAMELKRKEMEMREREIAVKEAESTYTALVKEMQDKMATLDAKLDKLTLEELRELANGDK
jgi:transposase-like protein